MIDNTYNYIPIPVIASFNTSGDFMPIWFRYNDCVYDVAVNSHKESYGSRTFECEIVKASNEDEGNHMIGKKIEIIYHEGNHIWGIVKNSSLM